MAWGCFTRIPCPYKKWREEDRGAMLSMFPLTGLMAGAILGGAWFCLDWLHAGSLLTGAILTFIYFLTTGYIHLDGFMDCSDAPSFKTARSGGEKADIEGFKGRGFCGHSLVFVVVILVASVSSLADGFSLRRQIW